MMRFRGLRITMCFIDIEEGRVLLDVCFFKPEIENLIVTWNWLHDFDVLPIFFKVVLLIGVVLHIIVNKPLHLFFKFPVLFPIKYKGQWDYFKSFNTISLTIFHQCSDYATFCWYRFMILQVVNHLLILAIVKSMIQVLLGLLFPSQIKQTILCIISIITLIGFYPIASLLEDTLNNFRVVASAQDVPELGNKFNLIIPELAIDFITNISILNEVSPCCIVLFNFRHQIYEIHVFRVFIDLTVCRILRFLVLTIVVLRW